MERAMEYINHNGNLYNETFYDEDYNNSYNNTTYYYYYYNNTEYVYIAYPLVFQVCIYILYNVVFLFAVLGNILVIYVVASSKKMQTVTNYLIANLALGDLLMAFLCVPFSYISVLLQYWPFGLVLCHVVSPAQATCVFVSAYTLVALAIDRYLAILYPLRPRLRRSQALLVIAVLWFVALVTAMPTAVFTRLEINEARGRPLCEESGWRDERWKMGYGYTLLVLQYFFPISVLIYTYTRIAVEIWGKKKPLEIINISEQLSFSTVEQFNCREQRLDKARRKTVVMTLSVVAGYTLAWLPFNLIRLYLESLTFDPDEEQLPYLEYIFFACHWLAMAHTTYNPLIYAYMNSNFRGAFTSVITALMRGIRGHGVKINQEANHLTQLPGFSRGKNQSQLQQRILSVKESDVDTVIVKQHLPLRIV